MRGGERSRDENRLRESCEGSDQTHHGTGGCQAGSDISFVFGDVSDRHGVDWLHFERNRRRDLEHVLFEDERNASIDR